MDTLPTVENPTNHSRKAVLLSIVGIVIGLLIGAGITFSFFKDAVFFGAPKADVANLTYPDPNAQKVPDINLRSNIVLPKSIVGEEYYNLINKIVDDLRTVGNSNVSTLVPLLDSIKQKSISRDFNGLFDLVTQAKNEVTNDVAMLEETRNDIANLKKINDTSTKDAAIRSQTDTLLASSDVFVREFLSYFDLVNQTLSGSFPTQSLLDKLTAQVTTLGDAGKTVQNDLSALLNTVKQKNDAALKK